MLEAAKVDELLLPDALLLVGLDCDLKIDVFIVHLLVLSVGHLSIQELLLHDLEAVEKLEDGLWVQ